jgi:hypothetical protein
VANKREFATCTTGLYWFVAVPLHFWKVEHVTDDFSPVDRPDASWITPGHLSISRQRLKLIDLYWRLKNTAPVFDV